MAEPVSNNNPVEQYSGGETDPQVLQRLISHYTESIEKLRLTFEQLEKRFQVLDSKNIYNSITEALITIDPEDKILTFNRAAECIFEVQEQDAINQPFCKFLPVCAKAFDDYRGSGEPHNKYEFSFTNQLGDPVVLQSRFSELFDRDGVKIGVTCLLFDLTEVRLLEEKARRSDRLTALGELAAGVAHEMRNPLTTIRGYLQILPDNKDDEEFIQEFSENLIREIDRLTRLTDDLLDMAKPISPERKTEQLSKLVEEIAAFLSEKFSLYNVQLSIEQDDVGTPVLIDADRMKQVFINLFVNAIESIDGVDAKSDGRIAIRFFQRMEKLSSDEELKAYAVAEIADNGPGIPEHIQERLFDPFFTTKDSGTGLGLALSNRIVEEHGGFLRINKSSYKGTAFWVMLPLTDS